MKKLIFILLSVILVKQLDNQLVNKFLQDEIKTPLEVESYKVTGTMYYATTGQCDSSPLITACGYKINPKKASEHKWIAVSRDLLKIFKYGDKVRIKNAGNKDGIYIIADTMNKRFKNKIDFLETLGTPIYKLENIELEKV